MIEKESDPVMKVAFIGGGNMATALISGLAKNNQVAATVRVGDPSPEVRARLEQDFGLHCSPGADGAVAGSDVVVLAVKPQVMPTVLDELSGVIEPGQAVVSVAAGITVATCVSALGDATPVIRTMPNTPALLGMGITGLYAGPGCEASHLRMAESIMASVGDTVWIDDESLMDVVTAVSGSGPAYFYLLVEALSEAGVKLGLTPEVAMKLARHTARGAGAMVTQNAADVAELRRRVTSPGGTTQAALETLQDGGFRELVESAVRAATQRGRELAGSEQAE